MKYFMFPDSVSFNLSQFIGDQEWNQLLFVKLIICIWRLKSWILSVSETARRTIAGDFERLEDEPYNEPIENGKFRIQIF